MKVMLFGATGMVGQGVLRECIRDAAVSQILAIGRTSIGLHHVKLDEIIQSDVGDLAAHEAQLSGYDACFFCLGVSSAGMNEETYTRLTYDLTLQVAERLARLNPAMTFVYVSGESTDSSESGRTMWARVKGKTENALLRLPFKAAYMFRPGFIQPMDGIVSKTRVYRVMYTLLRPLYPVLKLLLPRYVTTTQAVGKAMLWVAKHGASTQILNTPAINKIAHTQD